MKIDGAVNVLGALLPPGEVANRSRSVPDSRKTEVAQEVLRLVLRHRRLLPAAGECAASPCQSCLDPHLDKIISFIERGETIHFVLPAFPAKSPNPQKVVGVLPDFAERLALEFLQSLCDQISHFYAPGACITICSDGHVFSDLVCVPDETVSAYREGLIEQLHRIGGSSLNLFCLEDVAGARDFDPLRAELVERFATPLAELREQVQEDGAARSMFNGIHRFVFEDQCVLRPEVSRSKLRNETKTRAYQVIQRSNAWSRLVAKEFPRSLRLSIHPQDPHAEKIGIHMIRTKDAWLTPWHGTVLDNGVSYTLVKREEAERDGASLVARDNRPSHFVSPEVSP